MIQFNGPFCLHIRFSLGHLQSHLMPLSIDRPKPYAQRHGLLGYSPARPTQLLRHLRSRKLRFRKSPQGFHILRRPRTNHPPLLLHHHHSSKEKCALYRCTQLRAARTDYRVAITSSRACRHLWRNDFGYYYLCQFPLGGKESAKLKLSRSTSCGFEANTM